MPSIESLSRLLEKEFINMKDLPLRTLIFLALCCDLGLFSKRLIGPAANIITDALHIPGGISTGFSLMFLAIAAMLVPRFGCGTIMGMVQSVLALGMGMVGSMGALSPIGYVLPGLVIDLIAWMTQSWRISLHGRMMLLNAAAAVAASLAANWIVFRLRGAPLLLYLCVSATSGALCGLLGAQVTGRLLPVIGAGLAQRPAKQVKEG